MSAFDTTDLYLASYLHALGHELAGVRRISTAESKAVFSFEDAAGCRTAVLSYYNRQGTVVPHAYVVSLKDIKAMNRDPIVFAMANPVPEIQPEEVGGLVVGEDDWVYPYFGRDLDRIVAFADVPAASSALDWLVVHPGAEVLASQAWTMLGRMPRLSNHPAVPAILPPP